MVGSSGHADGTMSSRVAHGKDGSYAALSRVVDQGRAAQSLLVVVHGVSRSLDPVCVENFSVEDAQKDKPGTHRLLQAQGRDRHK